MAQKLSQLYDVDNRYREAKGVPDNNAGKAFLPAMLSEIPFASLYLLSTS